MLDTVTCALYNSFCCERYAARRTKTAQHLMESIWRVVRVVEGARLESVYTGKPVSRVRISHSPPFCKMQPAAPIMRQAFVIASSDGRTRIVTSSGSRTRTATSSDGGASIRNPFCGIHFYQPPHRSMPHPGFRWRCCRRRARTSDKPAAAEHAKSSAVTCLS